MQWKTDHRGQRCYYHLNQVYKQEHGDTKVMKIMLPAEVTRKPHRDPST